MRYAGLLTGLILWAGAVNAQTVTPHSSVPSDRHVLGVHIGGRVAVHPMPGGGAAYEHQWPGVYFESRFSGTQVFLPFSDPYNEYRLYIDTLPPVTIDRPGEQTIKISDLAKGPHTLRLEKVTESILDTAAFNGFYVPASGKALPVTPRARQIEFIGDSGMVGYGNRSTTVKCTTEEVRKLTDTQAAWSVLTARHFDADYQVNAISGRGVVRNYNGTTPGYTMSDVYPFTFFNKTVPYAAKDWQPQIVLIALGGNDLTPLQPGEPWTTADQVGDALVAGYARMVVDLHRRYPAATVVMQWQGPTGDTATDQAVDAGRKTIEEAAKDAGLKTLAFMIPPKDFKVDLNGCDYHGSLAGHRTGADWSIRWFEERPELWQGK